MHTEPTTFSADTYYATQAPPPTLERDVENVRSFIHRQAKEGRRVVLVTVRIFDSSSLGYLIYYLERWNDSSLRAQRVSLQFCGLQDCLLILGIV
jgi:hypothetical protein